VGADAEGSSSLQDAQVKSSLPWRISSRSCVEKNLAPREERRPRFLILLDIPYPNLAPFLANTWPDERVKEERGEKG
jgi:hypothetical protein